MIEPSAARTGLYSDERGASFAEFLVVTTVIALGALAAMSNLREAVKAAGDSVAAAVRTLQSSGAVSAEVQPLNATSSPASQPPPLPPGGDVSLIDSPLQIDPSHPAEDSNFTLNTPFGASYEVSTATEQSSDLGPNGERQVTLEITRTEQAGGELTSPLANSPVGRSVPEVSVGVFGAEEVSYRATLPEDALARIKAGAAPAPDPSDLSTLPEGSSITVERLDIDGSNTGLGFGVIGLGAQTSTGNGNAVSVEVGSDRNRVMAGPTDVVNNAGEFGVGPLTLGASHSLHGSEFAFADLTKDAAGQAAYEEFLRTGVIPPQGQLGVMDSGTVTISETNRESTVDGTIGAGVVETSLDIHGSSATGTLTHVTHTDGRHEVSNIGPGGPGTTFFFEDQYAANGQRTGSTNGVILTDVPEDFTKLLALGFGQGLDQASPQFQLVLDQAQYGELRSRALDYFARTQALSGADRARLQPGAIADNQRLLADGLPPPTANPVMEAFILNTGVEDFMSTLNAGGAFRSSTDIVSQLTDIYSENPARGPLPGSLQFFHE